MQDKIKVRCIACCNCLLLAVVFSAILVDFLDNDPNKKRKIPSELKHHIIHINT